MKRCILPGDFLLPDDVRMDKWAVIACDQFTSDLHYWRELSNSVAQVPSVLNMILPEAFLDQNTSERICRIHQTMQNYLSDGIFKDYPQSFIYVERSLQNGSIRKGILCVVDLEQYDFDPKSQMPVRATEETVIDRIPPRVAIRKDAILEFGHVIVFCDDPNQNLIESVFREKDKFPILYDFELQQGGGHICGWLVCGDYAASFSEQLLSYQRAYPDITAYLVADGNHSLVTAKKCYEMLDPAIRSKSPARYAMIELENIHSPAIAFEPIHRLVMQTDTQKLVRDFSSQSCENGIPIKWITKNSTGTINIPTQPNELAVASFQRMLDLWLETNDGKLDYIHDDNALLKLVDAEDTIGFFMPPVDKSALFTYVAAGHTLPRKTFSLGHAAEKRYYLEGRRIK